MLLRIEHTTAYEYQAAVRLGTHRLMVRPMEGHNVQVRSSVLEIEPEYRIRWINDVFGNSIALVDFNQPTDRCRIFSGLTVQQYNTNPFNFVLEPYANEVPFQYSPDEAPDLAPFLIRNHPDDEGAIRDWIRPFLNIQGRGRTVDFLNALNRSVPLFFQYARREEPGVQSPGQTLKQRSGSCRDFALLMMEAARFLNLGARFVSGYLCETTTNRFAAAAAATHAWTEIYLPGAGWKAFDPTCGIMAADLHVAVAVARDPVQAPPVSGTFVGSGQVEHSMTVTVKAHALEEKK